jgi:hypothetical protein
MLGLTGGDGAAMPDSMKILEGIMTSTQNAEKKRQEQEEAHRRAQLEAEQKAKDAAAAEAAKARPQHIMALARHLGIDPVFDTDLLWIAEKAFDAPLPSGWSAHHDAGGNEYYYNASDGTTCWEHPMEAHFRSLALQQLQEKERKKAIERNLGKGQVSQSLALCVFAFHNEHTQSLSLSQRSHLRIVWATSVDDTHAPFSLQLKNTTSLSLAFLLSINCCQHCTWIRNIALSPPCSTAASAASAVFLDADANPVGGVALIRRPKS